MIKPVVGSRVCTLTLYISDIGRSRNVLQHGEVQTNSSLFWKKKEYLVLTETHLVRFKNQGKASESFSSYVKWPPLTGATLNKAQDSDAQSIGLN